MSSLKKYVLTLMGLFLKNGKALVVCIIFFAIFLLSIVWAIALSHVARERQQAIEKSVTESQNIASIVAANLGQVFGRAVLYAKLSTSFLEGQSAMPAFFNPNFLGDQAYLRLAIFNAQEQLVYSSSSRDAEPELMRLAHNALAIEGVSIRPEKAIIVGRPDVNDPHTLWRIPVAIPLGSAQKRIGVFTAYIDLGYLLALYKEASIGTKSRIEILDDQANQLVELESGTLSAGRNIAQSGYVSFISSDRAYGPINALRPGDKNKSVGVYRHLDKLPLTITVTRDSDAVLNALSARHRTYRIRATLMSIVTMILSSFLVILAQRQRRLYKEITQSESQKKVLIEQLENEKTRAFQLASHDFLTGLPNRMMFYELAAIEIARAHRSRKLSALLFLDLNKFKNINDTLGHAVGDLLLKAMGQRLRLSLREYDLTARLGGDEFVVLVSDLESEELAGIIAGKLVESMSSPYLDLDGHDVDSSISIGIALYPSDGQDIDTLLSRADTAMYSAKKSGRGKYCFYESSLNKSSARNSELIACFPRAIRDNEFCLHYQMRVATTDFRPVGLEALIRWQHPTNGLIYPSEFIGLAEDNDFIIALGNWVIDAACAQVVAWRDLGCTALPVAVNISAKQLSDKALVDFMIHSLRRHDVPAALIEIEVTETCLLEHPEIAEQVLGQLHALGVKISLDDYGTGFAGLSHLKRLPITTVKIDRLFIRDIRNDSNDAMIVSSTIALSHNLGLKVVAEGVETKDQVVHLKAAGCDEIQGYYFHRPAPASEITSALQGAVVEPAKIA